MLSNYVIEHLYLFQTNMKYRNNYTNMNTLLRHVNKCLYYSNQFLTNNF